MGQAGPGWAAHTQIFADKPRNNSLGWFISEAVTQMALALKKPVEPYKVWTPLDEILAMLLGLLCCFHVNSH